MSLKVGDIVTIRGHAGRRFRILDFRAHLEAMDNPSETRDCKTEDLIKIGN